MNALEVLACGPEANDTRRRYVPFLDSSDESSISGKGKRTNKHNSQSFVGPIGFCWPLLCQPK